MLNSTTVVVGSLLGRAVTMLSMTSQYDSRVEPIHVAPKAEKCGYIPEGCDIVISFSKIYKLYNVHKVH